MKFSLLCVLSKAMLLYALLGASLAMAEPITCLTQEYTMIGISRQVMEQANHLRVEKDKAALQEMNNRQMIIYVKAGVELRLDSMERGIVAVRKVGSPDTWYAFYWELDCPQKPKAK